MKGLEFVASALLLVAMPAHAIEYQGRTIDGKKLPAKVFSYQTGGVYNAQVEFRQDLATVTFEGGSQLILRLNQSTITDPSDISGYGRLGQLPLSRWLGIGLRSDNGLTGGVAFGAGRVEDLWRINLNPADLDRSLQ